MRYAKTFGGYSVPGQGCVTLIETDISFGLHSFTIVGLGDKAISEAKDRISAAIKNCGYISPKQKNQKVVISLVPAHIKKEGTSFDVAMALAYLYASEEITFDTEGKMFIGELGLDGRVRKVHGILPILLEARKQGFKEFFIPKECAYEAGLITDLPIYAVETLKELISHLQGNARLPLVTPTPLESTNFHPDISSIKGLPQVKRALEIAAAGQHSIALYGPPGTGKTSILNCLPGICAQPSYSEVLEINALYSSCGLLDSLVTSRPFRAPHHSSSHTAILGGGSSPRPGEISLANHGVLFLDEFPHFDRRVIDGLRQPLEEKAVRIVRTQGIVEFPANVLFAIAMNPCLCGNYGITGEKCTCASHDIIQYQKKVSGPIIDRIHLWVQVPKISIYQLSLPRTQNESSSQVRARVESARQRLIDQKINLSKDAATVLTHTIQSYRLSPRVYKKLVAIARTIAALDGANKIERHHVLEALIFRPKGIGQT